MRRREFITLLGGAAAAWPVAARAQQSAMPVIGFLGARTERAAASEMVAFHRGLSEAGYVDGRNVAIKYHWAEGQYDRLPALAVDLVRRQVNLIISTGGLVSALAAKAATSTIPIVFAAGEDPVNGGIVASLNRPGGNLTGIYFFTIELEPKRLELLHEAVPNAATIAVLVNPSFRSTATVVKNVEAAARVIGKPIRVLEAKSESGIDAAFASIVEQRIGALLVASDPFLSTRAAQLVALAARHSVPAIYQWRDFVAAGGLMSYGTNLADAYRVAAIYAGRILKGEKPADLPIQQSVKVELVINLNTAKALGLTFPLSLLGRADEVIE